MSAMTAALSNVCDIILRRRANGENVSASSISNRLNINNIRYHGVMARKKERKKKKKKWRMKAKISYKAMIKRGVI
jgi:hypothetical protein